MKAVPAKRVAKKPAKTPVHRAPPPGEVRIIGGRWKRTKLPVASLPGLRPTPDRVRETLFNWLGQDLSGWHCVDAFAGTGALGLEAASRGAASVQMVEQSGDLVARLQQIKTRLDATGVTVLRGDGVALMRRLAPGSIDLVLLDPPFGAGLEDPALQATAAVLREDGRVYLESDHAWAADALLAHGLQIHRAGKAGMVHFHLLKKAAKA